MWLQFTIASFGRQFFDFFVDFNQTFAIGLWYDGCYQTFVGGHGNGTIDRIVPKWDEK